MFHVLSINQMYKILQRDQQIHLDVWLECYYTVITGMCRPHFQDGINKSSYSEYYVNWYHLR